MNYKAIQILTGSPGSTNGLAVTKHTHARLARLVYPGDPTRSWRRYWNPEILADPTRPRYTFSRFL
jgi:hypothetical protein